MIPHHFTVDVEEYFQVSAFEPHVGRETWNALESRVAASLDRLLGLLDDRSASGTFFVLGDLAKRHPAIVRRIASTGHEVASHGWDHRRVSQQTPEAFRTSVHDTKALLEDLAASPVLGFRAPSFSIRPGNEWALDMLLAEGYRYDSSLFPVRRPGYGYASGHRDPYWIERPAGRLAEYPPATLRWLGWNLPAGGGAYLRIFPYALVRRAVAQSAKRGAPATVYVHPWEVDPEQPRLPVAPLARFRHYTGLRRTYERLARLLSEFSFASIASGLELVPKRVHQA